NVMLDAQDIHDDLLRTLLVPHHGYEITTAGDSFQLAFHNIADAVAYCLDVQEQLLLQPWPPAFVDCQMPGSATITTQLSLLQRPKTVFHGVRVRMGIHASNPAEGPLVSQVHPVTSRMAYVGLSELIGREVSAIGRGGQIIVTAPIVRWLRASTANNAAWTKTHPIVLQELGVHRVPDLKIDLGIAQVLPVSLKGRLALIPPPSKVQTMLTYCPRLSNNYDLLISPMETTSHNSDVSIAASLVAADEVLIMNDLEQHVAYGFPKYSVLYTIFMLIALLASTTAAWTLYKYTKLVSSCVCYAMLSFFMWKLVYTFLRIVTLASMIHEFLQESSTWMSLDVNHDVGGFRFIGHEADIAEKKLDPPPYFVMIPLFIGDTALFSAGYWMLVLVVELLRVIYLNCAGLKLESVECRVVQKPLYIRLKRIFLIYVLTALPYAAIGWVLALHPASVITFLADIPNEILALSNMLFFAAPIALAFVLVANQQCMLSWCMVSDDVIQQIQANEAPTDFPVF
ncbi:hypothetical protein DYB37_013603, partial [Aphanomyces astaci]